MLTNDIVKCILLSSKHLISTLMISGVRLAACLLATVQPRLKSSTICNATNVQSRTSECKVLTYVCLTTATFNAMIGALRHELEAQDVRNLEMTEEAP